jgi:small GTP-binding protein
MEDLIKIIIAGLDNAGKTSILKVLDKKYDFSKDIISLAPTIRVEYHMMEFLTNKVVFWDMGGQEKYREIYQAKKDLYFAGTDLLLYVIDIQDKEREEASLNYLDIILNHFMKNKIEIPVIMAFHKYDPDIRSNENLLNDIDALRNLISTKYPTFKILYQLTSIYDVMSIVQMISYGLSVFDEKFFELSELLEQYLEKFNSKSLIIFDKNGIILSEFYNNSIGPEIYTEFLEGIKEHLILLKRIQEESYEENSNFRLIGNELLSYLHKIEIYNYSFFISVILHENNKKDFLEKFSDFLVNVSTVLESLIKT